MNAGPHADRLKQTISAAIETDHTGWVVSNHDFTRFATRFETDLRAAITLFLLLPGPVFILAGDELGTPDGPGADPPLDRFGRDRFRHPMPWDESANRGFTTGTPWLPVITPADGTVADQVRDPDSILNLFRRLIALRTKLPPEHRFHDDSPPQTLVLERGGYVIAVNLSDQAAGIDRPGALVLEAAPQDGDDPTSLPPHGARVSLQ